MGFHKDFLEFGPHKNPSPPPVEANVHVLTFTIARKSKGQTLLLLLQKGNGLRVEGLGFGARKFNVQLLAKQVSPASVAKVTVDSSIFPDGRRAKKRSPGGFRV